MELHTLAVLISSAFRGNYIYPNLAERVWKTFPFFLDIGSARSQITLSNWWVYFNRCLILTETDTQRARDIWERHFLRYLQKVTKFTLSALKIVLFIYLLISHSQRLYELLLPLGVRRHLSSFIYFNRL